MGGQFIPFLSQRPKITEQVIQCFLPFLFIVLWQGNIQNFPIRKRNRKTLSHSIHDLLDLMIVSRFDLLQNFIKRNIHTCTSLAPFIIDIYCLKVNRKLLSMIKLGR